MSNSELSPSKIFENCISKKCTYVCIFVVQVQNYMLIFYSYLFVSDSSNQENSVNILTVRRYVMGIGLVLVAIMVLINIFNIHTYRKRNNQDKETIHPAI